MNDKADVTDVLVSLIDEIRLSNELLSKSLTQQEKTVTALHDLGQLVVNFSAMQNKLPEQLAPLLVKPISAVMEELVVRLSQNHVEMSKLVAENVGRATQSVLAAASAAPAPALPWTRVEPPATPAPPPAPKPVLWTDELRTYLRSKEARALAEKHQLTIDRLREQIVLAKGEVWTNGHNKALGRIAQEEGYSSIRIDEVLFYLPRHIAAKLAPPAAQSASA
jgi:hypothetical protein